MKLNSIVFGAILLVLISVSSAYSQDSVKVLAKINDSSIDDNYLEGVKSDNMGLRASATYYLGERESSKAVVPLMDVLHTDKTPETRIMAALSLFKIGDARGMYAIQGAMKEDKNEWVRGMCKIFYEMYLANKKPQE
ncbi:MAG: HEAT repeat domain-containing protein [Ignavibacteriaceae bacterium]|jgi:HEAT repeat protein